MPMLTPQEKARVDEAARFIRARNWPRWPFLLLVKKGTGECAFLYADNACEEDGIKLYHANLFGLRDMTPEERAAIPNHSSGDDR